MPEDQEKVVAEQEAPAAPQEEAPNVEAQPEAPKEEAPEAAKEEAAKEEVPLAVDEKPEPFVDPLPMKRLELTSTTIPKPTNGDSFDYAEFAFLVPHEMLRTDMLRITRLLPHLNMEKCKWKAARLLSWYKLWTLIVHDHHDNEEEIFFPFYKNLGVDFPERQQSDHKTLLAQMAKIEQLLEKCVAEPTKENEAAFAAEWRSFETNMKAHLAEEEGFWPEAIRSKGEEKYRECHKTLMKKVQGNKSYAATVELACIVQSMGLDTFGNTLASGWADEKNAAQMASEFPAPLRRCCCLGPRFMRNWEHEKAKLHSLALDVEAQPAVPYPKASGACGGGWKGACAIM